LADVGIPALFGLEPGAGEDFEEDTLTAFSLVVPTGSASHRDQAAERSAWFCVTTRRTTHAGPVMRGTTRAARRHYDDAMSHTVVAELVAAVLKVEVEVGQRVAAEDAVVILESMKMEIPVLAEVAGSVAEVVVEAGDVVNDGDPLVVITTPR